MPFLFYSTTKYTNKISTAQIQLRNKMYDIQTCFSNSFKMLTMSEHPKQVIAEFNFMTPSTSLTFNKVKCNFKEYRLPTPKTTRMKFHVIKIVKIDILYVSKHSLLETGRSVS